MELTCECCHYTTTVNSNYAKHLLRNIYVVQTASYKCDISKVSEYNRKSTQIHPKTTLIQLKVSGIFFHKKNN
jgi:hypothetical protein